MKPVFKCDYCNFMGTEEEVEKHEPKCMDNYDRKSCKTCVHRERTKYTDDGGYVYECDKSINVPVNCVYEFCSEYERKEKNVLLNNLFPYGLFGGFRGF